MWKVCVDIRFKGWYFNVFDQINKLGIGLINNEKIITDLFCFKLWFLWKNLIYCLILFEIQFKNSSIS
jgi:hypothetical protein